MKSFPKWLKVPFWLIKLLSILIILKKFFFKFLDNGGLYIIEDYKHPEYYSTLNNTKNELSISQIIEKLKKKELINR